MKAIGHTTWAIPGGQIPPRSSGREPDHTSRDSICLLNTGAQAAELTLTLFYADREPVGPYELVVEGRRVRSVRVNDLIDPEAVPLDTPYALLIEASVPIVVQFTRVDTSQEANAVASVMAFAVR
jgi:hypothetical protein